MIYRLNADIALGAIRHAFNPLVCVVELYDYQNQIRFRVYGPDDKAVLSIPSIPIRDVVDRALLSAQIQRARALVERKGFNLKPWTPRASLAKLRGFG